MKRLTGSIVLLLIMGLPAAGAHAAIGALDAVPGATLLLPYFEVDLSATSGNGINTLFTIQNASATAVLTHITSWSDLGIPTIAFDVYLTGYDAQAVDLRAMFMDGTLPSTASAGQDIQDAISPRGSLSQDINYATCTGILPPATLSAATTAFLRNAHTGLDAAGSCYGRAFGDNIARGYVTIDIVTQCSSQATFPSTAGYFQAGGLGIAGDTNVLWGEYRILGADQRPLIVSQLVSLEASATDARVTAPGQYTFYGYLVAGTAIDNREPLGSTWAAEYVDGRTDLLYWRDNGGNVTPFTCGSSPAWFPLGGAVELPYERPGAAVFSSQELLATAAAPGPFPTPISSEASFANVAGRIVVGGQDLAVPFKDGWVYTSLNAPIPGVPTYFVDVIDGYPYTQSYVGVLHDIDGQGSMRIGMSAQQVDVLRVATPTPTPTP
ncbi:MAG: hypothetical protein HYV63_30350 [Candidatus Schekmanbacteria bacterium]|nr:hypothetical protein [Candidatus Schekmanbacteria bacterium]